MAITLSNVDTRLAWVNPAPSTLNPSGLGGWVLISALCSDNSGALATPVLWRQPGGQPRRPRL